MEKTILQRPQHTARFGMRPKNMSHTLKTTSSVGQILPIYYDMLYPGDKLRISDMCFTRTQPMHTAALISLTEHIEYFFVPCHLLNSKFTDFFTGVHSTPFTSTFHNMEDGIIEPAIFKAENITQFLRIQDVDAINEKTGDIRGYEFTRLMESLGYGHNFLKWVDNEVGQSTQQRSFNPLRLQAYQKICQDYFWREDWDEHNMRAFNSDIGAFTTKKEIMDLCELHTAPWKRDFFTISLPQVIFGQNSPNSTGDAVYNSNPFVAGIALNNYTANTLFSSDSQPNTWYPKSMPNLTQSLNMLGVSSIDNIVSLGTSTLNRTTNTPGAAATVAMASNLAQMRLNMALEKLYTITNFAKKDYVSQIAAHFGYKVNNFLSYRCMKLASHSVPLEVNPVVSTAETDQANLAALAGYATGKGQSKKVNFTAPCHGIFMAVYYCLPEADYGTYGLDEFNTRSTRFDFFNKEFDNLGMVPFSPKWADLERDILSWNGFTYRNLEEKLKYNKISAGFLTEGLSHWTASRSALAIATGKSDLYVQPSYLDSVMLVQYFPPIVDDQPQHEVFTTDPLLHLFRFNVVKLSIQSVFGLPQL